QLLATENQRLPIDVPQSDRATLGGTLAANVSGPRRYGFGTLRDYVIGISVVNDEGQEVKAGGRVVKNVAGYDLMKLYTGSLGTLGIISQVTLKVKPLPEASRWIIVPAEPDQVTDLLARLSATRTRPCAITVQGRAKEGRIAGASVVVGFEDNARAVEWQVARLGEELPDRARGQRQEPSAPAAEALIAGLRDFPLASENA